MKPIKLIYDKLRIATNQDDIVLDLFGGSGSTMIACEQLGRKCYMCEIDPRYVDVIINRWEKFTGKQAQLINE
jgi:site-specific DNA-methyltransferase (adenine-specific)